MSLRLLAIVAVVSLLPRVTSGQTWTSADGRLALTTPDATQFTEIPKPPSPFEALWISADESTRLAVVKSQIPAHVRLNQTGVEKGLAGELGGNVTRLPTKQIAGYDVWAMRADGPGSEVTQLLVRIDNQVYKVMAFLGTGSPHADAVQRFVDSLAINNPGASPATEAFAPVSDNTASADAPIPATTDPVDTHGISKLLGSIVGVIVIGLVVYFAAVKLGKKS